MYKFPLYRQHDQMDCGPTCLRMIAKHHGRSYSMDMLGRKSGINCRGVSLLSINEATEEIGLQTAGAKDEGSLKPDCLLNIYELPAAYQVKDLFYIDSGVGGCIWESEWYEHNESERK